MTKLEDNSNAGSPGEDGVKAALMTGLGAAGLCERGSSFPVQIFLCHGLGCRSGKLSL